jgi:hypothetical protein
VLCSMLFLFTCWVKRICGKKWLHPNIEES